MLLGLVAVGVGVCGCGSTGGHLAARAAPPTPVAITVYVDGARVSASPSSVGAGPATLVITNQASGSESLSLMPTSGGSALASTAPINPQGTTQVSVELSRGTYTLAATTRASSEASAAGSAIAPARLSVGAPRRSSSDQLMEP